MHSGCDFDQSDGLGSLQLRKQLKHFNLAVGPVEHNFKLLGLRYPTSGVHRLHFKDEKIDIACARARRTDVLCPLEEMWESSRRDAWLNK